VESLAKLREVASHRAPEVVAVVAMAVEPVEIPIVYHLVMQCTKAKHLIYFYKQFRGSLIEHEQHQA